MNEACLGALGGVPYVTCRIKSVYVTCLMLFLRRHVTFLGVMSHIQKRSFRRVDFRGPDPLSILGRLVETTPIHYIYASK